MTPIDPKAELRDRLRDRLDHEGRLLNNRTSMFLVANGLGAVAIGLGGVPGAAVIGVLVVANGLWLLCGLQTRSAIRSLTRLHFAEKKTGQISDPADDAIREGLRWVPKNCHTTDILGLWMPLLVTAGWFAGALINAL